jgi:hypothetical protein
MDGEVVDDPLGAIEGVEFVDAEEQFQVVEGIDSGLPSSFGLV